MDGAEIVRRSGRSPRRSTNSSGPTSARAFPTRSCAGCDRSRSPSTSWDLAAPAPPPWAAGKRDSRDQRTGGRSVHGPRGAVERLHALTSRARAPSHPADARDAGV